MVVGKPGLWAEPAMRMQIRPREGLGDADANPAPRAGPAASILAWSKNWSQAW